MEGYEVSEIARAIGMSRATVNRKLERIRQIWRPEEHPNDVAP